MNQVTLGNACRGCSDWHHSDHGRPAAGRQIAGLCSVERCRPGVMGSTVAVDCGGRYRQPPIAAIPCPPFAWTILICRDDPPCGATATVRWDCGVSWPWKNQTASCGRRSSRYHSAGVCGGRLSRSLGYHARSAGDPLKTIDEDESNSGSWTAGNSRYNGIRTE